MNSASYSAALLLICSVFLEVFPASAQPPSECPASGSPGDLNELAGGALEAALRVKLAIEEPHLASRFPGLQCVFSVERRTQKYINGRVVDGESITIGLRKGDTILAREYWVTSFPRYASSSETPGFIPAKVKIGGDVLMDLLRNGALPQDEVAQLSRSRVPEMRIGALENTSDVSLIASIGINDHVAEVRSAARNRLSELHSSMLVAVAQTKDQTTLARLAADDTDSDVRRAAVNQITDQTALAKVAIEGEDYSICQEAVSRMSDQIALGTVAINGRHDNGWTTSVNGTDFDLRGKRGIDELAVEKIDDVSVLRSVAARARTPQVAKIAASKLPKRSTIEPRKP